MGFCVLDEYEGEVESQEISLNDQLNKNSFRDDSHPAIPCSHSIKFGPEPTIVRCIMCKCLVVTRCERVPGRAYTVGMTVSAFLVPVFGVGLVPGCALFACRVAHDIRHRCPQCLGDLGRWKRI